jgi:hypothetical protein
MNIVHPPMLGHGAGPEVDRLLKAGRAGGVGQLASWVDESGVRPVTVQSVAVSMFLSFSCRLKPDIGRIVAGLGLRHASDNRRAIRIVDEPAGADMVHILGRHWRLLAGKVKAVADLNAFASRDSQQNGFWRFFLSDTSFH